MSVAGRRIYDALTHFITRDFYSLVFNNQVWLLFVFGELDGLPLPFGSWFTFGLLAIF